MRHKFQIYIWFCCFNRLIFTLCIEILYNFDYNNCLTVFSFLNTTIILIIYIYFQLNLILVVRICYIYLNDKLLQTLRCFLLIFRIYKYANSTRIMSWFLLKIILKSHKNIKIYLSLLMSVYYIIFIIHFNIYPT